MQLDSLTELIASPSAAVFRLHSNYKNFNFSKLEKKDEAKLNFSLRLSDRFIPRDFYYHHHGEGTKKSFEKEVQVHGNTRPNKYVFDVSCKT